ncbi:F-box protein CPR1-like [Quercus suber]|uniref:F-box protein CPR1-like n=1 Tax=Quercus suber TaxID=58331 RepID=UPI0032DE3350
MAYRLVLLPYPNIRKKSHGQYRFSLGFGYHAPTTDYKLVKFVYFDDFVPPVVEIYTLHTGVWRFVIGPDLQYIVGNTLVFVNALHWLARTQEKSIIFQNLILSFDLGDEVFHEVLLPKILEESCPGKKLAIAALDGLLAIHGGQLEYYGDDGWVVKEYSVWVMKEYGVVESWTKLYTIDIGERFGERFIRVKAWNYWMQQMEFNNKDNEDVATGDTTASSRAAIVFVGVVVASAGVKAVSAGTIVGIFD